MGFLRKNLNKYLFLLIILTCMIFYYLGNKLQTSSLEEATLNKFLIQTSINFNIDKDLLVFLHIQKTGGSDFDRNIVKNLLVKSSTNKNWTKACKFIYNRTNSDITTSKQSFLTKKVKFKKYTCERNVKIKNQESNWYFSRQTFGWICGLHPDYTDLNKCVKKYYTNLSNLNFHYFTILRDPIKRYLSEWQHVTRGATWKQKKTKQNCLSAYEKCFANQATWQNVSLFEFMACKHNLANNRQTRLLAEYDANFKLCSNPLLTGVKNVTYDAELLSRAKLTLQTMSFFALNEYQYLSGLLFETAFNNVFKFEDILAQSSQTIASQHINHLDKETLNKIKQLNYLDIMLYDYAVDLFNKRVNYFKIRKF